MAVTIKTNNVPRETIDAWELTAKERTEFDYLNWAAIERGEDSATFVRYKGRLHDLGEFSASWGITRDTGLPDWAKGWSGYTSDSAFSGLLVRFVENDAEYVVMGWYYVSD